MDHGRDLESIIVAAHALTRVAALETRNEAPAAQWRTLAILRERGPLRVGELAQLSRTTQPGITRLIGSMAQAGLVERVGDPDDSRAVRVIATDKGREAYATWRVQLAEALLPRFADLEAAEWDAIRMTAELLTQRTAAAASKTSGEESPAR